jgi:hypothetical protein
MAEKAKDESLRMKHALTELAAVMEEEVRIGEELLRNLADQKEAILSWDSSTILARVEEKEVLIHRLGTMEEKRQAIMVQLCRSPGKNPSLRELLAQLSLEDRKSLGQEELRVKEAKGQESRAQSQESRAKESGSKPLALSSKLSEPLALSSKLSEPLALSHSAGPSVQDRLSYLQHQAREIYSRLRAEEKGFVSLMQTLLGHLREALSPLSQPPVPLYGKRGTLALPRPESGLVQGKI